MCGPNKITIVITKHILSNCQSGYAIFTFCGPIRLNSIAEQAVIRGDGGLSCLMSEEQKEQVSTAVRDGSET